MISSMTGLRVLRDILNDKDKVVLEKLNPLIYDEEQEPYYHNQYFSFFMDFYVRLSYTISQS
jgi:hypothetical protein